MLFPVTDTRAVRPLVPASGQPSFLPFEASENERNSSFTIPGDKRAGRLFLLNQVRLVMVFLTLPLQLDQQSLGARSPLSWTLGAGCSSRKGPSLPAGCGGWEVG